MPLAHVITGIKKYSAELALELRKQGFEVQTSSSSEAGSATPDLEITLNRCAPEAAASAIGVSASTRDMCVFVTPQAMAGHIRSIDIFVLTSQTSDEVYSELPSGVPMSENHDNEILADSALEPVVGEVVAIDGMPSVLQAAEVEEAPLSKVADADVLAVSAPLGPVAPPAAASLARAKHEPASKEEPDLVPHGMIWRASNPETTPHEGDAEAAEEGYSGVFADDENDFRSNLRALFAGVTRFAGSKSQASRSYKPSFSPATKWKNAAISWPTFKLPKFQTQVSDLSAQGRRRDARLRNAMAMALGASLLALAAVSLAGRYTPNQGSSSLPSAAGTSQSSSLNLAPRSIAQPPAKGQALSSAKITSHTVVPLKSTSVSSVATKRPVTSRADDPARTRQAKKTPRRSPDSDYVAKDTTVYFDRRGAVAKRAR